MKLKTIVGAAAALAVVGALALAPAAWGDEVPLEDPTIPTEVVEDVVPEATPEAPVEDQRPAESLAVQSVPSPVEEADTTPYILAAWQLPGDVTDPIWPGQLIKTWIDVAEGDLNALDGQLVTCGVDYQIDLYYDDETTASLLSGGVLNGPNNPAEHLAYEAVKGNPWKYIDNEDCVTTNVICETYTDGGTATNLDANGWVPFDTRSAGHAEYVEGGLHIYTDDASSNAKLQRAKDVADFPLSQVGQFAANYDTGFGPGPGVKVVVDFDGIVGTLIWESVYDVAGEQDLWLPESSNAGIIAPDNGGGYGSTRHGTVNEWLVNYPDATVLGIQFGIGSGVFADGVLHTVTAGCTTYSFDYQDIPVVVELGVSGPSAQCGVDGQLPTLPQLENIDLSVSPAGTGPGTYTVTATAHSGYIITGQAVFEIVVPEALLFQSDTNEAPCFVELREGSDDVTTEEQACGVTDVDVTTIHTSWVLNPVTGELVKTVGDPVVTKKAVTPTECPGLAFTGADNPLPYVAGGLGLIMIGLLVWVATWATRRRNQV